MKNLDTPTTLKLNYCFWMLVGMNISVEQGEDAIFACHTKNLGNFFFKCAFMSKQQY